MKAARGKEKLISVLIPSRGRIEKLKEVISSIADLSKDKSRVEILVRFDLDDEISLSKIRSLPYDKIDIMVVVGERFGGYKGLHHHVNDLCAISRAEFVLLFNDDAYIKTKEWDEIIAKYSGQLVVLNPNTKDVAQYLNTFPIVPTKIINELGHFSLQTHNDTWIQEITRQLGIERAINDLVILHDRFDRTGNNKDQVWDERTEQWQGCRSEFDEPRFIDLRRQDVMKIANLLGRTKQH
jgi:hypothetical protein